MNRLMHFSAGFGIACCLALPTPAISADITVAAETGTRDTPTTLWISTKTTYGYDNRYLKYPNKADCLEALQQEKARVTAETEVWCAAAPGL